ncbi:MAG: putative Ig domain-containing protein [Reichenbachiella sp.]|uniref:putative Ig domain-containing protein n=1 Tax=Reichenbachiella sp. TaxID=2184521 RepID=UPI002965DA23|nr:putative Ig domain-containing protein [Reichenbachiella sp.]MDW3208402.1 putative Ig domain-containing protein [Reichenbachiella sp.]
MSWEYSANPGTTEYVRAQVFNAEGSAASSKMNIATSSFIDNPKIAADKDGGFAVVYVTSSGQEIKIEGSRHNRFGSQIETVEFYNENYTGNSANHPAIGMNNQGDFVVAWNDNLSDVNSSTCNEDTDCDGTGVYFKKYGDPENEPYCVVDESQVNDYSAGTQHKPAIDIDINGNYVVVWEGEWHGSLEDSQGILGQRYKADGTKDGEEFHVNTSTNSNQSAPDVAVDGSGHFIVTWSGYAGTSRTGIFAQMYNSDGLPNGSEFRVDQETTSYYRLGEPSVDINHDGDAVIVWEGSYGSEINARVVNGPNSFGGNEFKVNASTFSGARNYPDVAIQDDDSFVVTWGSWVSGGEDQTFIRRFDSQASPLDANDIQISDNTNFQTRRQSIAMDKVSGDFMVAFTEYSGSYSSVLASKYKSDGTAIFEEEELTNYASTDDIPDVSANLAGEFVVAWNHVQGNGHMNMSIFDSENELIYENYEAINPENFSSQGGVAVALDLDGDAVAVVGAYYGGGYNVYTKTIAPPLAGNVDNGMEFIVNSITSDNQTSPDVAQNADGDFVVVWRDTYAGQAIKAQRYNEKGIRQGSEIIVNNNTSTSSRYPSVALNDEGNFMVVWHFYNGGTGGEDVMGSVYDWNGEVVKDDFILNSDETDGHQVYPDIALDENGDFRVIWSSTTYSDDSYSAIATKKFSPTGVAESAVTNYLTDDVLNVNDHRGSIAINEDGDIAVSYTYGYDGYELYLNVFNKALESQVEDLQISNSNEIKVFKPAITATEDGDFVVAWVEGSDYHDLLVRKYSSGATFDGNAIEIDAGDRPNEAGIQAVDDGDFILTFVDEIDDSGDYDGIWAQRLSYEMEKIGPEFLVNDTTQNDHSNSAMASSPDGSYTVVWEADYTDGSNYAVMAKQFVSHKPTVEVNDLSLDEGAEADITSDELLISNPSGGDESPLLTVTLLPSQGTLKLDGNAITLNQQLNEDDMFFLSYEHNGEEGTFDLFTFTVANEDFETGTNSFYISVNPVNDVPTVANPIPDQSTTGFESFSYTVPANTFTDVESEELTLSATLSNGSNLPSWLSFNAATRTFSGTVENDPDFDRTITIKVSASDGEASASDEFNIAIASVLTVDESNPNGVQLYPNPTEGQLHLRPPAHMVGTIDLYMFNASGQLLDQSRIEQTRASMVIDIDVAHLKKGLYLLKLVNENATTTYKINKD